jgi:sugar/nucleoside kinase (ribokinase family)
MPSATHDVVGIGNAIVDVIAHADETFLSRRDLVKGTMRLIDAVEAERLYADMGSGVEMSGGSVANTMAGIASLGGRAGFIGLVRDDQLGQVFRHDISAVGVAYRMKAKTEGPATARCLILVTPDAQRTMNTFLGACVELGPEDLDRALIEGAQVLYLEGYLFDPPRAKAALRAAAEIAHAAGRKVSLSLSDPFCVERHRADFRKLIADHVDILFANEIEIGSLYETDDFQAAAHAVARDCEIAVLTRSGKGSVVVSGSARHEIPPAPVAHVFDTTGAGDLYASGFLYGVTHGRPLEVCGRLGSLCAAEIISHIGARPERPLKDLALKTGLL